MSKPNSNKLQVVVGKRNYKESLTLYAASKVSNFSMVFFRVLKKFLVNFAIISLIFEQFLFVFASTVHAAELPTTPDGSTNTQIDRAANNVSIVNIAPPNASGLSHNKFESYNVNTGGQIINNFSGISADGTVKANPVVETQIGGLVVANPNLVNSGSAKVILNEVTSGNVSQLLGYTEIAGAKADLILANPNGITCAGCGFINTARLVMVAGSSNFDANNNLGFNLKEQKNPNLYVPLVTIDGLGLDVTRTGGTEIVASSVKLLSSIFGSESNSVAIRTGEGKYDYATNTISENNTQNNTDPVFAIDASALAQIQAGQVYLVATKQGVGVKMEGEILASQTLNLDANGDVYYKSISVGDTANLRSSGNIQTVDSDAVISAPTANIAANQFNNSGLVSAYNLNIQNSATINNSGNFEALNLNLSNIANINNSGLIFGQNSLAISGGNLTNNSLGNIYSLVDYSISLSDFLTNSGLITSANNLILNSNQLNNSAEISAQNDLNFAIANSANNSGNLIAGNGLNFSADSLTNSGVTHSAGNSTFTLSSLFNQEDATVYSKDSLNFNVATILKNSGQISAGNGLTVTNAPSFNNLGTLNSSSNLNINAISVFNSGQISTSEKLIIDALGDMTNNGNIFSNAALTVSANNLINNSSSTIVSFFDSATLSITDDLTNNGEISSNLDLEINAKNLTNAGDILSNDKLTINAQNSVSNLGNFQSASDFSLISTSLVNSAAINSFGKGSITSAAIINQDNGLVFSADDLTLISSSSFTNSAKVLSGAQINLTSALTNNSGEVFASDKLVLNLTNTLTNSGSLSSLGNLTVQSNSDITNTNQILSNRTLSIAATNLTNSNLIQSNDDLSLNLGNLINTYNVVSGKSFTIAASENIQNSGILQSADNFTINASGFSNARSSLILAGNDLTISASSIDNQNTKPSTSIISSGIVSANGAVSLLTDSLNNNSGLVAGRSTSVLALNASNVNLSNTLGAFISTAAINLDLGNVDYTITGTVTASNIDITANNITNQGNVIASDFINLNATGNSGVVGSGNITNGFASGDNSNVQLAAGTYVNLVANNNINNYGIIIGTTDTTLTAINGSINNYATGKISGGSGSANVYATNGLFNNTSQTSVFTSNNNAIFNVKDLSNNGEISVANDLTTNVTNNLTNNPSALIWSGRDIVFNVANTFLNNQADIYADRNLTIQGNSSSDASQNKTKLVQNISGNIETYSGDIDIKAITLENKRSSMKSQGADYVYGQAYVTGGDCHRNWKGKVKCNPRIYRDLYAANILGTAGLEAAIFSGNGITIDSNSLLNDASSIISLSNFGINTSIFNNNSYTFVQYDDTSRRYEYYNAYIKSGGALTITQNDAINPSLINGSNVDQYTSLDGNSKKSQNTSINQIDSYQLAQTGAINVDLSSIVNAIKKNNSATSDASLLAESASSAPKTSTLFSILRTGGVLAPASSNIDSPSLTPSTLDTVFSGNFKINLDKAATTPLVESRSQFTDVSKFFGSSYYFERLGLNAASFLSDLDRQARLYNIRMLGDSAIETKLIIDQLKNLTNDSVFLSKNITNYNQQIKELLDNSVNQFAALGLKAEDVAIKGLTKEQVNSLTKDIVTFELTSINGISVLAPKIYLSQDTRNRLFAGSSLASTSTIFSKDNVTIDSPFAVMTNSGSIASDENVVINVGSIKNASTYFGNSLETGVALVAKIKSGGDLAIMSNNSLSNISGVTLKNSFLDSKGAISIVSKNNIAIENDKRFAVSSFALNPALFSISSSSIKDSAASARSGLSFNAASDIQLISSGSINVANNYFNTGGSIFMTASQDINNSNYTIKASDNVVMSAGNDINNVQTAANNNETRIEAGNIVSLDAGHDINNIGATIKGGSLVYLTAGNDINNKALVNYTINGSSTNSNGSAITESQALASDARYISSNLVSQGNIESGGNLVMVAANDINIKGSNTNSTGSSYLEATNGNINITTAALRDKTFAEGGKRKKHWVSITDNTTNIESNVTSNGTLDLVASGTTALVSDLASEVGNINITGSKLTSADNLTLSAKNDIAITSAQDTTYSFEAGRLGRGKSYLRNSNSTTQVESELTTTNNGDISITSGVGNTDTAVLENAHGSIALIASKLTTKDVDNDTSNNIGSGNIALVAKEDLTISSALNNQYSESNSTKKGLTVKKSSTTIDGSATNVSSELNATGDIATISGNDTNIIASNLFAQGSGSITSGGQTNIYNGVDTTTHYSNTVKERTGVLSNIPVVKEVFQVVDVVIGGTLNGITGGNWNANSTVGHSINRVDGNVTTEKIITSNLNFANNLIINSEQDLSVRSSKLTSISGDIALTSNLGDVSITAATANNTSNWRADTKTDRSKAIEERANNSGVATASEIIAGKDITITSAQGDATLQAAKLTSGTENIAGSQDITVSATNGNIYLLAANNTSEVTHTDKSKGTYSFSNGTSGHIHSAVINNEIRADGGNAGGSAGSITFDTENQIIAQFKNTGSEGDASAFVNDAKLSYLSSLDPTKTTFILLDEAHVDWDQTARGLTKTGTAVIGVAAVAATILTLGTAAPITAAVAAGGWSAAGGSIAVAVASSAAATASISATNASMNVDGNLLGSFDDVGKTTLKDTTSKDAMRNYAVAAVAAGLTSFASEALKVQQMSNVANATKAVNEASKIQQTFQNLKLSLTQSAISNTSSTIAKSAINGDSFSDSLGNLALNIAIGAVGNAAAKEIGNAAHSGVISTSEQLTLHAALGCGMGAAQGGNCAAGAVAGVVGEMAGAGLRSSVENGSISKQAAVQLAGLSGSAAALLTSAAIGQSDAQTADNIFAGQIIGSNAAENNGLKDAVVRATVGLIPAAIAGKGDLKEGYKKIGKDTNAVKGYAGDKLQDAVDSLFAQYPNAVGTAGEYLLVADQNFATPLGQAFAYPATKAVQGANYLADTLSGESGYLANHGYDQDFFTGLGITTGAAIGTGAAVNKTAYNYYLNKVDSLDVATAPNSAVFYSGRGNRELAENFAITNNKQTLEMTNGGSWLDQQNLYKPYTSLVSKPQANQIWDNLSQKYAQEASGSVVGFVDGARSNSTFNRIEYPTLINNKNITNIITGGK